MRIRALLIVVALVLVAGCRERDGDDAGGPMSDAGMIDGGGGSGENTAALCADGMDNDDNGFTDCGDRGCCGVVMCPPESFCGMNDAGMCNMLPAEDTMEACTDGCDNDGDMFADCRDFSCSAFCGTENSNRTCIDGEDNDMDGFMDCMDRDCEDRVVCGGEATNANCSDGMDNDGDGSMDCMDSDCQDEAIVVCDGTTPVTVPPAMIDAMVATLCTDGMDNDGDDRFDCGEFSCLWNHAGCVEPPRENTNGLCANGMDDDQDGLTDCMDPGCDGEGLVTCDGTTATGVMAAMYEAMSNAECMGGGDEDMDGFADCLDFSCNQNPDVTICPGENTDALCGDMMDNDSNGFADCLDFSCQQHPSVTICASENDFNTCSDGTDNNDNMFADCRDNSCERTAACTNHSGVPAP